MTSGILGKSPEKHRNNNNTVPTVKRGGRSLMLWWYFVAYITSSLVKVNGTMRKEDYDENSHSKHLAVSKNCVTLVTKGSST